MTIIIICVQINKQLLLNNMLTYNIIILLFCVVSQVSSVSEPTEVCYKRYGCFSILPPFNNTKGLLPESLGQQEIEFWLYTYQYPSRQVIYPEVRDSIRRSSIIKRAETVIIIHDLYENGFRDSIQDIKTQLLLKDLTKRNIIILNWSHGASPKSYLQGVANTRVVGAVLGLFLTDLYKLFDIQYDKVHLIGHGAGAHIAGYAGKTILNFTAGNDTVGKITGLDPTARGFVGFGKEVRLHIDDANFVDIMHTNDGAYGYTPEVDVGHVDFVVNGGKLQPGCKNGSYCSHIRAVLLYAYSIRKCVFKAQNCSTGDYVAGAEMGFSTNTSLDGTYCVKTTDRPPFCEKPNVLPPFDYLWETIIRILGLYDDFGADNILSYWMYDKYTTEIRLIDRILRYRYNWYYGHYGTEYGYTSDGYYGRYYGNINNQLGFTDADLLTFTTAELLNFTSTYLEQYSSYSKAQIRNLITPELRRYVYIRRYNTALQRGTTEFKKELGKHYEEIVNAMFDFFLNSGDDAYGFDLSGSNDSSDSSDSSSDSSDSSEENYFLNYLY